MRERRGEQPVEYVRFGRIVVHHADPLNWTVSGDGRMTYHVSLPRAVWEALDRATTAKAKDADDWLYRFRQYVGQVDKVLEKIKKIVENKEDPHLLELSSPNPNKLKEITPKNKRFRDSKTIRRKVRRGVPRGD